MRGGRQRLRAPARGRASRVEARGRTGNRRPNGLRTKPSEAVALTSDEKAVIEVIRGTPWGEVIAEMRQGRIANIRRTQTIRPPSLLAREDHTRASEE